MDINYNKSSCDSISSTFVNVHFGWIMVAMGVLATIANCVVAKASYDLNKLIERNKRIDRQVTLRSLARSHSVTYFFIIHLSFAHAVVCLTLVILTLPLKYDHRNTVGPGICILKDVALLSSICQHIYIIAERYWSLVFPLQPPTATVSKRVIFMMWMLGAIFNVPDAVTVINMKVNHLCANKWYFSLARYRNPYFVTVFICPAVFILIGSCLTLCYLRNAHRRAAKCFSDKSIKALNSARTLTRSELLLLLMYSTPLVVFSVVVHLSNSEATLRTLNLTYMLMACYSIATPFVVLSNYAKIARRTQIMLRLHKRRAYDIKMKNINIKVISRPIALVHVRTYNTN